MTMRWITAAMPTLGGAKVNYLDGHNPSGTLLTPTPLHIALPIKEWRGRYRAALSERWQTAGRH
jgi:hypothetical protein